MRYSFFSTALVATWFIFGGGYNERYCAYADGAGGYESCSYPTLAACRAYIHGVGGMCRLNARYGEEPPQRKPRKRYY